MVKQHNLVHRPRDHYPMTRCDLVTNETIINMVHNPCGPPNKVKGVVREEVNYYFASKTSVQRK